MGAYEHIFRNAGVIRQGSASGELFSTAPQLCSYCLGPMEPHFKLCYQCKVASNGQYKYLLPQTTIFLTYGINGEQSGTHLGQYKNTNPNISNTAKNHLQRLVTDTLRVHGHCIQHRTQRPITGVAFVPSGKARDPGYVHPLQQLLEPFIGFSHQPIVPVHRNVPRPYRTRDAGIDPSRYSVDPNARDRHILLFEDSWVTGANPLSTAVALRQAGAQAVTVFSLARHLNPRWQLHESWLKHNPALPYSTSFCPVHRNFNCTETPPPQPR